MIETLQTHAKAMEIGRVHTFEGYRELPSVGSPRKLTITIHEGTRNGQPWWSVTAEDEDGRTASGNGADDLRVALATVHWSELNNDRIRY